MFYGDSVQDTRKLFFSSFAKHKQNKLLLPLEAQLVDVMLMHPEYHALLESEEGHHDQAYFAELGSSNPFLHMGLHLAIRDQIATDRPAGFATLYQQLITKYTDAHQVDHLIMEPLAECLWQAQKNRTVPDERAYLEACRKIL